MAPTSTTSIFITMNNAADFLTVDGITFINGHAILIRNTIGDALTVKNCIFKDNVNVNTAYGIVRIDTTKTTATVIDNCAFINNFRNAVIVKGTSTGTFHIRNSRFVNNKQGPTSYGGISILANAGGALTLTNNTFIQNEGALQDNNANNANPTNLILINNKFYSNGDTTSGNGNSMSCTSISALSGNSNLFCGNNGNTVFGCNTTQLGSIKLSSFDGCKVCGGFNENKDCNGICWGNNTSCRSTQSYYVNSTATINGNGSRSTPFNSIQSAIDFSNYGDTIKLLPGTYNIATTLNTKGKAIKITKDDKGEIDNTIINYNGASQINAFTINSAESYDTLIDSITISNFMGGGISIQNSSPTITNCKFINNYSTNGGGAIKAVSSNLIVKNTLFIANSAVSSSLGNAINIDSTTTTVSHIIINNCKFINNTLTSNHVIYIRSFTNSGSIVINNSTFVNNASVNGIAVSSVPTITVTNNSFYATRVACVGSNNVFTNNNGNLFCNGGGVDSLCTSWNGVASTTTVIDSCSVCGGTNRDLDCSNTCFGSKVTDNNITNPGCCYRSQFDCNNICNGISIYDNFNTCCYPFEIDCEQKCYQGKILDKTLPNSLCCFQNETDCEDICYQGKQFDSSIPDPLCCFTNQTDCANHCYGTREFDSTIPDPLCCYNNETDCSDICFGQKVNDSTLPEPICCYQNETDCSNICYQTKQNDSFGNCCYSNQTDCYNECYGDRIIDPLQQCCYENNTDCKHICNGDAVYNNVTIDMGICCFSNETDCLGICFGPYKTDINGTCCLESETDCMGICNGTTVSDKTGQCCIPTEKDCNDICNGNNTLDDNDNCCLLIERDCGGYCNGNRKVDKFNNCCFSNEVDCEDICFGQKTEDSLGNCCHSNDTDCNNICFGSNELDSANNCCILSNETDCKGICFGRGALDNENVCCDAAEIICGVCNGTYWLCTGSGAGQTGSISGGGKVNDAEASNENGNGKVNASRAVLYAFLALLWVLVVVAIVSIVCILKRKKKN